jgi:hypothetical protein
MNMERAMSRTLENINEQVPVGQQNTGQQNVGQQNVDDQNIGQQNNGQQHVGQQNTGQQSTGQQNTGQQGIRGQNQNGSRQENAGWNAKKPRDNLNGDLLETARYCGLETHKIRAYAPWSEMEGAVFRHIAAASIAAIIVQWGTTGSSVLIAYLTPMKGLGCRSGGYLFYGGLGTIAWLFLVIGQFLSHEVMLRYQAAHIEDPDKALHRDSNIHTNARDPDLCQREFMHSLLCGLAVSFRYVGKTICIINTLWLIVSSLFEFIGAYDNCWCQGNAFSMRDRGWIALFKNHADLAAASKLPWGGGLIMSILVCLFSYAFFWLGSRSGEE